VTTRPAPAPIRRPCRFEGAVVKAHARVRELDVLACGHPAGPGTCSRAVECRTCPLHPGGGWVRHLLYYVCPIAADGGAAWRWNVGQLLRRVRLFGGRRVCAVATHLGTIVPSLPDRKPFRLDPPGEVRDALAGHGFDVFTVPHHAGGETAAFTPLWDRVAGCRGEEDVTFYAHAKGVSHPGFPAHIRAWAETLYAADLDYWPLVERQLLARRAVVGSMRQAGADGTWIYSGAFYWVRNRLAFRKKTWRTCRRGWSGVELWPGAARYDPDTETYRPLFSLREAGVIFKEYPPGLQAYDPAWWAAVAAEFAAWEAEHAADATRPGDLE
jgi:hypothetical protein